MHQFKLFVDDFKLFKRKSLDFLSTIRDNLISHEDKCNPFLRYLEKLIMHYSNSMGKMIRDLTESPKNINKFATYDTNCFFLEFHMIVMLCAFIRTIVTSSFPNIYAIHKELMDKLSTGEDFLGQLKIENKCTFKKDLSLAKLLEKHHRRFIKTKINLDQKVILTSEAILEFFVEGYPINYNSNSFFCSKYYRCVANQKDCKDECIIVIDVRAAH